MTLLTLVTERMKWEHESTAQANTIRMRPLRNMESNESCCSWDVEVWSCRLVGLKFLRTRPDFGLAFKLPL